MDIQTLSNLGGLLSLGMTLLCIVVGGFYMMKTGANTAQASALAAMQAEMTVLRGRIDDQIKDNARQGQIIDTICIALKSKGIIITITGEMITIDDNQKSTVVRINSNQQNGVQP